MTEFILKKHTCVLHYEIGDVPPGEQREVGPSWAFLQINDIGSLFLNWDEIALFRGEDVVAIRPGKFFIDRLCAKDARTGEECSQMPAFSGGVSAASFFYNVLSSGVLLDVCAPRDLVFTVTNRGEKIDRLVMEIRGKCTLVVDEAVSIGVEDVMQSEKT